MKELNSNELQSAAGGCFFWRPRLPHLCLPRSCRPIHCQPCTQDPNPKPNPNPEIPEPRYR